VVVMLSSVVNTVEVAVGVTAVIVTVVTYGVIPRQTQALAYAIISVHSGA
jgi:hypothetical protein